jgi:hypothetical protein
VLASGLLIGGSLGPDVLGNGVHVSQRVVFLGLVALVPVLDFRSLGRGKAVCAAALAVALVL